MNAPLRRIATSALLFLALFTLVIPGGIPAALAQELTCQERLNQADAQYKVGQFEEVIVLLSTCLENEGFGEEERQQAYRLLGLSYLGNDLVGDARRAIRNLLELVPNYQVNPEQDPPMFVDLVDDVREEMQPEPELEPEPEPEPPTREGGGSPLKWVAIGGGALAAGVLGWLLLGGSDENGPGPPPLPCPIVVAETEPNDNLTQSQVLRGRPDCTTITVNGNAEVSDGGEFFIFDANGVQIEDFEDLYRITTTGTGLSLTLTGHTSDCDLFLLDSVSNLFSA